MKHLSENINFIDFRLLECQVDIVLRALELYTYNLHFTFCREENYEILNSLIYYTYESIMSKYSNCQYRVGYDIEKTCKLELNRIRQQKYFNEKKFKKVS